MVDRAASTQALVLPGQHDELGGPVTRVGSSYDVARGLELVDELAHGLRAHVRGVSEFRGPRAGRVDFTRTSGGIPRRRRRPRCGSRAGYRPDPAWPPC
jgi:hypothetical protein